MAKQSSLCVKYLFKIRKRVNRNLKFIFLCAVFVAFYTLYYTSIRLSSFDKCNDFQLNSDLWKACKNDASQLVQGSNWNHNTVTSEPLVATFNKNENHFSFKQEPKRKSNFSIMYEKFKKNILQNRNFSRNRVDHINEDSELPKIDLISERGDPVKIISNELSTQIRPSVVHKISTISMFRNNNTTYVVQSEKGSDTKQSKVSKSLSLKKIKEAVSEINSIESVYNDAAFEPLTDNSVVIIIQVHKRLDNLRELIKSFEKVRGIESALLIFSHDYYDEDILNCIKAIKFVKFMIIFFPYAIQINPNSFPGESPGDCPKELSQAEAEKRKCNMYQYPDNFGHYREGHSAQIKHHWWWKANMVFDKLEYTKHHNGLVLLLEDDLLVTEDLLHVINLMQKMKNEVCKPTACDMLFLGFHDEHTAYTNWISNQVDINDWHSIGLSFTRTMWEKIKNCSSVFCTYDDYNWDWTLRYTFQTCFQNNPTVLAVKGPRVFHTGECGFHHQEKKNCDIDEIMGRINVFINKIKDKMFPEKLEFVQSFFFSPRVRTAWGGWSDPRDHSLCKNMTNKNNKI